MFFCVQSPLKPDTHRWHLRPPGQLGLQTEDLTRAVFSLFSFFQATRTRNLDLPTMCLTFRRSCSSMYGRVKKPSTVSYSLPFLPLSPLSPFLLLALDRCTSLNNLLRSVGTYPFSDSNFHIFWHCYPPSVYLTSCYKPCGTCFEWYYVLCFWDVPMWNKGWCQS